MNLNFCSQCHNIYELILKDNVPTYQCKVCGHTETEDKGFFCIHSNQVGSNFKCYKSLKNKHTIYDPTLPRLNNIPCVNDACFTNRENCLLVWNWDDSLVEKLSLTPENGVKERRVLTEDDISSNYLDDVCLELLTLQKQESIQDLIQRMRSKSCQAAKLPQLVSFRDTESYGKVWQQVEEDDDLRESHGISPIQREVVFLKYDNDNLKYLYMCCTCGASWTNMS